MGKKNKPHKVFIAYARKDKEILDKLLTHLSVLERIELMKIWHDGLIVGGQEWEKEIMYQLNTADTILLLISRHFIHSDFCYEQEMEKAFNRRKNENINVIPIIASRCLWEKTYLGSFQALPTDGIPITSGDWKEDSEKPYEMIAMKLYDLLDGDVDSNPFENQKRNNSLEDDLPQSKKIIFGDYIIIFFLETLYMLIIFIFFKIREVDYYFLFLLGILVFVNGINNLKLIFYTIKKNIFKIKESLQNQLLTQFAIIVLLPLSNIANKHSNADFAGFAIFNIFYFMCVIFLYVLYFLKNKYLD